MKTILADSAISANKDVEAQVYKHLSEYYTLSGMPDSAQVYHVRYLELNDSIFSLERLAKVKDLNANYDRQNFLVK